MNVDGDNNISPAETVCVKPQVKDITPKIARDGVEVDISDGLACEMFGIASSSEEVQYFCCKFYSGFSFSTCAPSLLQTWDI